MDTFRDAGATPPRLWWAGDAFGLDELLNRSSAEFSLFGWKEAREAFLPLGATASGSVLLFGY